MNKGVRVPTAAVLATGLAIPLATASDAGDGLCDSGFACGYDSTSYDGAVFGTAKNLSDWGTQGFANRAESVSVNGAECKYTVFYRTWHWWDSRPIGKAFTLYSRQLMKKNYRDPNLSNGAGYDSDGSSVNNDVEATEFTGC